MASAFYAVDVSHARLRIAEREELEGSEKHHGPGSRKFVKMAAVPSSGERILLMKSNSSESFSEQGNERLLHHIY